MNRFELIDRIAFCQRELESLQHTQPGCANCITRIADTTRCKKYGPIPQEHYATGCDDWAWDDIPF